MERGSASERLMHWPRGNEENTDLRNSLYSSLSVVFLGLHSVRVTLARLNSFGVTIHVTTIVHFSDRQRPAQRRMADLKGPSASGDISSTRLALASCSSRTSPLPRTYGASRACLASLVLTGVFWVIRPLAGLISEGSLVLRTHN